MNYASLEFRAGPKMAHFLQSLKNTYPKEVSSPLGRLVFACQNKNTTVSREIIEKLSFASSLNSFTLFHQNQKLAKVKGLLNLSCLKAKDSCFVAPSLEGSSTGF